MLQKGHKTDFRKFVFEHLTFYPEISAETVHHKIDSLARGKAVPDVHRGRRQSFRGLRNTFFLLKTTTLHIPWGRCYDHNFLRFLTIFGKKLAFFSKNNVMVKILHNLALFLIKNAEFFGENI
jgi:hypothetical protein